MRDFKLGIIVRADETGLGFQTRDYYKHLKPDKTILIDLSPLNGNEQHYEWYENYMLVKGIPSMAQVDDMLDGIDVLLTAETPYNLELYKRARERGVKTICVENAEFYDHIKYPEYEMPDLIILPSVWHLDEIKNHAESRGTKFVQIHHPVDRELHPFKLRTGNRTMHTAGKPATYLPTLKENSDITLYPFYPNFVEVEGRMISILHIKNGTYLYGEPDSFGSIYKQDRKSVV